MTAIPRLAPGSTVVVAGPDVPYVVGSLETTGATAVLHLRTEDGLDWSADRPATYVLRRRDEPARAAYVDEGSLVESLAAARIGIEHVEHHGRPLRFVGSSVVGDLVEHRFACQDRTCPVRLAWSVTGS